MLEGWWPGRRMAVLAATCAAVFVVLLLLVLAQDRAPVGPDLEATTSVHAWAAADIDRWHVWRYVTHFGEARILYPLYAVLIVLCLLRRRIVAAVVVAVCGWTYPLLSTLMKTVIGRPRPAVDTAAEVFQQTSFPSGHSGGAMTLAVLVFLVLGMSLRGWWRLVAATVFLVPLLVGTSRMALGVHYPTDVLAAFALALVWAIVVSAVVRRIPPLQRLEERHRPSDADRDTGPVRAAGDGARAT